RYDAGTSATEPLAVIWPEIQPITYRVHLEISGQDHPGLMNEVARCAANIGINVSGGRAYANQSRHRAAMTLTLDVPPNLRLDFVLRRLHTVPGVLDVQRDMMKGCDEKRR
ncbi:MAG TPA: ACT domain-containing protein, partial [Ktedonobacterales bacterium]|nr:ACT domain-containing protein [Ktedonobacterales bacterium]